MRARRRSLLGRATGRVLDLGGARSHAHLWADVAGVDDVTILDGANDPGLLGLARDEDARFDTVVSILQLTSTPDLDATIRRIASVLDPGGRLLFLEPGRGVGIPGRAQVRFAPVIRAFSPWHVDRDIPADLRAGGLSVVDLERQQVPTMQWWLRNLQIGVARHELPPARNGDHANR